MPQIRVDDKVYKQVVKIAKANFRGYGDQVAYWAANDCPHPVEMREEKNVQVSIMKDGESTDKTLRVFFCKQCRHHVVLGDQTELAQKIDEIVSE